MEHLNVLVQSAVLGGLTRSERYYNQSLCQDVNNDFEENAKLHSTSSLVSFGSLLELMLENRKFGRGEVCRARKEVLWVTMRQRLVKGRGHVHHHFK